VNQKRRHQPLRLSDMGRLLNKPEAVQGASTLQTTVSFVQSRSRKPTDSIKSALAGSCFHPITTAALPKFLSQRDAVRAVVSSWENSLRALHPFKCGSCPLWHVIDEADLAFPSEKINDKVLSVCPHCTSKRGKRKLSYLSSVAARDAMTGLTVSKGLGTRLYPCPHGYGWHVTSH
jgi:hypothetical protein